ncbi:MAG TPA: hypothetical protein VIY53_16700 [Acidobacteriaceae bacterium]
MNGLEFRGEGDDVDILLGVSADALCSFLEAPCAGSVMPAHVPGALAAFAVVRAFAFVERRELARAVLLDADLKNPVEEVAAHFLGSFRIEFPHFFPVEPAFRGEVFGSGGDGLAEAFTLLDIAAAVVAPDGVEGFVVAFPGEVGSQEVSVEIALGLGDGEVGDGLLFGGLEARGAGDGEGGDLEGVEDFAGAPGVEGLGKEAVRDLGGDDLEGVVVFEEGDGDASAGGANGEAVGVADAEDLAVQGGGSAGDAADGEGAAAAGALRGLGWGRGGLGCGVGHLRAPCGSVQRSAVSGQRSAVSGQRSAVSDQRSAVSGQRSAVSGQRSAISGQRSAISDQRSAETEKPHAGREAFSLFLL